jgi:uncharacterized protein (DUF2267 family)
VEALMNKDLIGVTVEEIQVELKRLQKIETAANAVVRAFTNNIDYDSWDKALDKLEEVLKEKA